MGTRDVINDHFARASDLAAEALVRSGRRRTKAMREATFHAVMALLGQSPPTAPTAGDDQHTMSSDEIALTADDGITLYDRLTRFAQSDGVFAAVTHRLYDRILGPDGQPELGDTQLAPYFRGIERHRLERHMTAFLIQATGGPRRYTGRGMQIAHQRLLITDEAFTAVIAHVADTLREFRVPEEWIAQIAYLVEPLRPSIVSQPAVAR